MSSHYFIGYAQAKVLRNLIANAAELEAVLRLADFAGTPADLRTCVAILERSGRPQEAAELCKMAEGDAAAADGGAL